MRNFSHSLFLLGILFIASCQKNEKPLFVENEDIQKRESFGTTHDFSFEKYRGCYNNMMDRVQRESFEESFGEPTDIIISYKNDKGVSTIYPILKNDTITTLLWINGISDGYFISKNALLSNEEIEGTTITKGVSKIFELNASELSTSIPEFEIKNILGENYVVTKNDHHIEIEELVELSDNTNAEGNEAKGIVPVCDEEELADLYFIIFGFHDESGQFPNYVFPQSIMIEAINTMIDTEGEYCICPNPCYLLRILNEREDIPQEIKEQLNANMVTREFDADFVLNLSDTEFYSLASLMGRGGCSIFWECGHNNFICVLEKIDCYNRLNSIEVQYGINTGYSTIDNVIFGELDICLMSEDEILNEVFESFSEEISEITPENSSGADNSGFHNRQLECESFNFTEQLDGDGWIACVEGLYFSKNLGGAYAFTDEYCVHFTIPRIRFDGTEIAYGMAQDCAAWAANASAAITGFAYVENPLMTDEAIFLMFKVTFNIKAKLTECGYGATTNCDVVDCMGTTNSAIWTDGFFDWLDEIFFGCN